MLPDVEHLKSGRQRAGPQSHDAGEVSLGTSIMAATFEGGVVIGADSRTTMGSYIVRRAARGEH